MRSRATFFYLFVILFILLITPFCFSGFSYRNHAAVNLTLFNICKRVLEELWMDVGVKSWWEVFRDTFVCVRKRNHVRDFIDYLEVNSLCYSKK